VLNNTGFDLWANDYDKSVNLSEENNAYPFAGYKNVLNNIYQQVRTKPGAAVLDIGFGTGVLTTQLYNLGCEITGIDFSDEMIRIAKEKMPSAKLFKCDFSNGLPDGIHAARFDFIISTYAFHHIGNREKAEMIKSLCLLLNENGEILIGDVSFQTRDELESCKDKYHNEWDNDEIYFVADEIKELLEGGYFFDYRKISHCAGIMTVTNRKSM
jgi:putative AdoMet-dependent methyltransferase